MSKNLLKMSDRKPYLLRALYQWIIDNDCTPHLLVAYPEKGWVCGVPTHILKDDILVLNISPTATPDCIIDNDGIYFSTRFSGELHKVSVDIRAVVSIIARETQEGMMFDVDEAVLSAGIKHSNDTKTANLDSKNHLKIIR